MKDWKAACRTWKHNRKEQKKKEEEPTEEATVLPDGMTLEQWNRIADWMVITIWKIAGKITPVMFAEMKRKVNGDSKLLRDILEAMNDSVDNVVYFDIMEEYDRLLSTEEYNSRL